jgi:hypothetical protein
MCQRAVAEATLRAKLQDSGRQSLVSDLQRLGGVVRISQHHAAARSCDPNHFIEALIGVGDMLDGAVGRGTIEYRRRKWQGAGIGSHDAPQTPGSLRGRHRHRAVKCHNVNVMLFDQPTRTCASTSPDLKEPTSATRKQKISDESVNGHEDLPGGGQEISPLADVNDPRWRSWDLSPYVQLGKGITPLPVVA